MSEFWSNYYTYNPLSKDIIDRLYGSVSSCGSTGYNKEESMYMIVDGDRIPKIKGIKIIVPNKVVEVMFYDGKKEKMVCHKDDEFDLFKCCAIAISKHKYKHIYTQKGIEIKAMELMLLICVDKNIKKVIRDMKKEDAARELEERIAREQNEARIRHAEKKAKKKRTKEQKIYETIASLLK